MLKYIQDHIVHPSQQQEVANMTFRELKVKDVFGNPQYKAILAKYAPSLANNPAAKLMGRKSCGEVFDLVVSKGLVPEDQAKKIEEEINALL